MISIPVRTVIAIVLVPLAFVACTRANSQTPIPPPSTASVPAATVAKPSSAKPAAADAKEITVVFVVALADPANAAPAARSASEVIAAKVSTCWQGGAPPDAPPVGLELALNTDGSVSGVEVADHDRFASDPSYRRAALAATRAFLQCGPFTLPAASYADWSLLSLRITAHPA
jgi:hypothetical protein